MKFRFSLLLVGIHKKRKEKKEKKEKEKKKKKKKKKKEKESKVRYFELKREFDELTQVE